MNPGAPESEAGQNLGAPKPRPVGTLAHQSPRWSWTSRPRTWRGAKVRGAGRSTNKHNNQTGRQDLRKRAWWVEDATEGAQEREKQKQSLVGSDGVC